MKILVLMPCQEQSVYAAAAIYKNMAQDVKDKTFMMPLFMDYLVQTKLTSDWVSSFYDTLVTAKTIIAAANEADDDLIIFGNVNKDMCEFDAIFSFQDIEETLPYEDKFLEKIKQMVSEDELLTSYINHTYSSDDAKMWLRDCRATADFLGAYIKTDTEKKLKKLQDEYEKMGCGKWHFN